MKNITVVGTYECVVEVEVPDDFQFTPGDLNCEEIMVPLEEDRSDVTLVDWEVVGND